MEQFNITDKAKNLILAALKDAREAYGDDDKWLTVTGGRHDLMVIEQLHSQISEAKSVTIKFETSWSGNKTLIV